MKKVALELDHICILVKDLKTSAQAWMAFLGAEEADCLTFSNEVPEEDTWYTTTNIPAANGIWIQLIEPGNENGGMAKQLAARGEGVQHVGFVCPDSDLDVLNKQVTEAGLFRWIFPEPRGPVGKRYQMIHPKTSNGIIVETLSKGWEKKWRARLQEQARVQEQ